MADQGEMKNPEEELPPDVKDWSKHQVKEWVLGLDIVDHSVAEILFQKNINGPSLLLLGIDDFKNIDVTLGPAKLLIHARELKKEELTSSTHEPGRPCKPYPFGRQHDTYRYIKDNILDIPESGPSDLIEPCHEYKAFTTSTTVETDLMTKFTEKTICFAAACMNTRTNGTIHFGIGDKRHGQVLGMVVRDRQREDYTKTLRSAIDGHFEHKHKLTAQKCIKPPRLVGVLNKNMTSSDKCVIEVDIVPDSAVCEENFYYTYTVRKKAKKKAKGKETPSKQFFIRDGGSTMNLITPTMTDKSLEECKEEKKRREEQLKLRKQAEERHLSVIKSSTQGSSLSQMITGGSLSLDKSNFERYVIVTNKSHPNQLESLGFLVELNPTAVLDFDPEHGLQRHFEQQSTTNVHLPTQYKIKGRVEDMARKLKLTRNTSWVFCNGGIQDETPSDIEEWLMDKGASIRDVISFLCRKDVLPNKRFLVIFLLLSTVSDEKDPLVETFSTFFQELKGTEQILCICDNERAFTSWNNLIEARCGAVNISQRCIYELSFAEVNGTVLSLLSKKRRSSRFLPCGGESKVLLENKVKHSLNTLEVLCVNQCEGGSEDKIAMEENFYKGGKVSWWNFYFSEQLGSTAFIKRDKFDFILNTIQELCSLREACVLFNLQHVPGCGGTTLAMHTLWALRKKFRCAVLRDNSADRAEVADQVVKLLTYDHEEQLPRVPVLLMLDDFDDKEKVFDLQQLIEKECVKKNIQSKSAQVILLNCMTAESSEWTGSTKETVFFGNDLSETEQKLFEEKLKEIEQKHNNAEKFYGFMIMKKNFKPEYVQSVVCKTLKSFNMNQKPAQLLAVLVLLSVYCKDAALSVSLCEEFLGLKPKPVCGSIKVEADFGKFSTLVANCRVEGKVAFKAVKMIHSSIAKDCLKELAATHNVSKADITNFLLTTDELYESTQGNDELLSDVRHILVKRHHSAEESQFSPLIQDITSETPGLEETVLENASKRFMKDGVVFQLLARYNYLKKKDFSEAADWAGRARDLSKDNPYFADTVAQVIKYQLKDAINNCKEEPISPENLDMFLKMAQSAIEAFRDAQNLAKKESDLQSQSTDNRPFNTAGHLGEIQVGVLIIEVLDMTPIFSSGSVHHDIMSEALSGDVKLQDVERNDEQHNEHTQYYITLRQFENVLYNLRYRMEVNFDFFDNIYMNLGSRSGMKDSLEEVDQKELFRCFTQYADLFCQTNSASLLKNTTLHNKLKLHKARQYLEMQKADTFSGILNCLSNDISPEEMEEITKQYAFVCAPAHRPTVKERINFIYVSVVLSCIKLESPHIQPYQKLIHLLCRVLKESIPITETLPLHFITVVLLWPQKRFQGFSGSVGMYITQLKASNHSVIAEVCNGKSPIVHFFLGKKRGYKRLVHLGEIKRCIKTRQEEFAWENGKIWQEKKVEECLLRVNGEVKNNVVLADTCIPKMKLEVPPMFLSQLRGRAYGSKVSFFIGFSMKGPLAIDID